ncbi:helix-turn-helix domain-containing protein [Hymenobacter sp. BT188]|uniref:AraC family transcriptional regulator n=1 Tax=Hymenobacter sp. BT188 TaxID=2763504 RepID=UPI001651646D|nr:helix-turn-helix domain-containing protein [Hymenobacter sp. BT188]MBC6605583.1 helix-turn-helix domain-containing protein [Hymenobacter sp. BT188]
MKAPSLPVLALAAFPSHHQHLYYIQQLEVHVAQFPHVQEPHAHDFYLLLYVTHGHGTHTIDLIIYDLQPGSLFFLMPGQVHSWSLSADTRGFILFFSEAFYIQQYPASRLAEYPFFNPSNAPVIYSVPAENGLLTLLGGIYQENTAEQPVPNRDMVVRAYLFLYLELSARWYPHQSPQQPAYGQQHIREFGRLLNEHFRNEKTVGYYAERLSLTANHLNAICRRLLNKTASALIHERVVAEAQRQLKHSAQSVAQVADALGFEDASYFTRYFKKYVGQTPEAFRQHQNA